jgi:hypothetical protein
VRVHRLLYIPLGNPVLTDSRVRINSWKSNGNPHKTIVYEVTKPLPNVTFDVGRSFSGNIPIPRGANLSLFFWAVESKNGSFTDTECEAPWHIWLNGYFNVLSQMWCTMLSF